MIDLTGKPIAITGASSGIGRATAIACAAAGMPVALGARRVERLRSAVEEITRAGGRAIAVPMDVDRPEDCRALIDRTVSEFGPIYAVFANAGYGIEKPIHATSDQELRAIFETNFFGTMSTIRPALERMLPARSGHILICSSCLAKLGIPLVGAYSATKAAQDHIARAMRAELAGSGLAVSSVHPVGTRTEFFELSGQKSGGSRIMPRAPGPLMQPPERVARAIIRTLRRGRGREVWTSAITRLAFAFGNAFPSLADWGLRRAAAKWMSGRDPAP